jgi:peptidyl-prolyl cis-trans isomerase B (cyclophilin B)
VVSNEQRRRQLAREKFERQQQRRQTARRKSRQRNLVIAGGLALVIVAAAAAAATGALSGGDKKSTAAATPTPPATSATAKAPDPCADGAKKAKGTPKPMSWKKEPALSIDKSAAYTMKLATTCGDISIDLEAAKAPRTVNSFSFLAGKGFLDHTRCHRLTDSGIFVLQCGDPQGTGQGGPGYTLPDENLKDPRLKGDVYPAGTIAMANRYDGQDEKTRNTGGSQFFLVYKKSQLPANYTPFGTIQKSGMTVLKKIADGGATAPDPTTQNTAPNATVVINKATVTKKP